MFSLWYVSSFACDVCGGPTSGQSLGLLPAYQKHFVGMRLHTGSFSTTHPPLFQTEGSSSKENFSFAELRGRFYAGKNWQILGYVPIGFLQKRDSIGTFQNSGLADVSLAVNRVLWNTMEQEEKNTKVFWMLGAGVKLPTGKSRNLENNTNIFIPNMQLGSGSVDYFAMTSMIVKYNKIGAMADASYMYKTENSLRYRFGNRSNANLRVFYQKSTKNPALFWVPSLGLMADMLAVDTEYGHKKQYTGGWVLNQSTSVDVFYNNWHFNALIAIPFQSYLSESYVTPHAQFSLQATYLF